MPGRRKKIFQEIMHFQDMTLNGHALAQEPLPGGHDPWCTTMDTNL